MKKYSIILAIIVISMNAASQDMHFSQFYETPQWRNPSLGGLFTGKLRSNLVIRNQWENIPGGVINDVKRPYRTLALNAEYKLIGYCADSSALVLGLQIMRDEAGDSWLKRVMILPNLTYRLGFGLAAGIYAGPVTINFRHNDLYWDDQYINGQFLPNIPSAQPLPTLDQSYFDLGGGISYAYIRDYVQWYIGAGVFHANTPVISFGPASDSINFRLARRWTFNGALAFSPFNEWKLRFYADKMIQGGQQQLLAGAIVDWYWRAPGTDNPEDGGAFVSAGILHRWKDAWIPTVGCTLDQWNLGLSYDINSSELSKVVRPLGAFELTLKYRGIFQKARCGVCPVTNW